MIGISMTLYNGESKQKNITGIQAVWYDVTQPIYSDLVMGRSLNAYTDSEGVLNLDLSNSSNLKVGDSGFLTLYKLNPDSPEKSLVYSGKEQVSDIVSGVDMYQYSVDWVRPSDWPTLDSMVNGVEKIQGLFTVQDIPTLSNAVAFSCSGAYHVNWGDGTSEDIAEGVLAQHSFDFSNVNLGPVTSKGFKCAVITITPQDAQHLTAIDFQKRPSNFSHALISPWLDLAINAEFLTSLKISNVTASIIVNLTHLQQVSIGENSVTDMSNLFYNCMSLHCVPYINASSALNTSFMFRFCTSLQYAKVCNTSKVTNMSSMFASCYSLKGISKLDTSSVLTMANMFYSCSLLRTLPILFTPLVTDVSAMLSFCSSLESVTLDLPSVTTMLNTLSSCPYLRKVTLLSTSKVTNMASLFENDCGLESVDLFDTSAVTNMDSMFSTCYTLRNVPLFDTSKVTNMSGMFASCYSLKRIPPFDTSKVTNMTYMLINAYSFQEMPLLNTALVTDMTSMLASCISLMEIPLLNTASMTVGTNMFSGCASLKKGVCDGTKVNISYAGCSLSAVELNAIYTKLATVTGKSITITGNEGATSSDKTIATAKGWTVV